MGQLHRQVCPNIFNCVAATYLSIRTRILGVTPCCACMDDRYFRVFGSVLSNLGFLHPLLFKTQILLQQKYMRFRKKNYNVLFECEKQRNRETVTATIDFFTRLEYFFYLQKENVKQKHQLHITSML